MADIRPLWLASLVLVAILLPGVTSAWARSPEQHALAAPLPAAPPAAEVAPRPVEGPPTGVPAVIDAALDARPLLERAQVVALYGYPGIPAMGDLGKYTPDEAAAEVRRLVWVYDSLNGDRGAVGALDLIVSVAQAGRTPDGTYLSRLDPAIIASYVEAARRNSVLLILDTQLGTVDPLEEARRLEPFLTEPFVHLALDPEFALRARGGAPGRVIGSVDAAEVNAVQSYLAGLVRQHGLPPKLLVVHQFRADMLTASAPWQDLPEVQRVIDVDAWGNLATKLGAYAAFGSPPTAPYAGLKLFEGWDVPLLAPSEVLALPRQPDLVIYQ